MFILLCRHLRMLNNGYRMFVFFTKRTFRLMAGLFGLFFLESIEFGIILLLTFTRGALNGCHSLVTFFGLTRSTAEKIGFRSLFEIKLKESLFPVFIFIFPIDRKSTRL